MATYRKRGNAWRVEISKNGIRKSGTFDTKKEAKEWAVNVESDIAAGKYNASSKLSIQYVFDKYKDEECIKHDGERWEKLRLDKIARELPSIKFSELTSLHISGWKNKRLKSVKESTVRREMVLLSQVFNTALNEWKFISESPLKGVKKPPEPPPRRRHITKKEIKLMMKSLSYQDGVIAERTIDEVAIAFLIGIETAMRAGEILSINKVVNYKGNEYFNEVNLRKRTVFIGKTKNGESRYVPLTKKAMSLIKCLPDRQFTVSSASLSSLFRKYRIKAEINDLTFHDSRSEGITRLSKKVDVLMLAKIIGHKDIKSLMFYYNESAENIAKLLD